MDVTVEIVGTLKTSALLAVVAAGIVQILKLIIRSRTGGASQQWEALLPGPVVLACTALGVLASYLGATGSEDMNLVQGGSAGLIAGLMAVFGYDFVKGAVKVGPALFKVVSELLKPNE